MPDTLITIELPHVSGIEKHNFQHQFVLKGFGPSLGTAVFDDVLTAFDNFYEQDDVSLARPIGEYIPAQVTRSTNFVLRAYDITNDLSGTPHGSPFYASDFSTVPAFPTGLPLPSELCAKITLEAEGRATALVEQGITRPKSRRTGGIYFGPLHTICIAFDVQRRRGELPTTRTRTAADTND